MAFVKINDKFYQRTTLFKHFTRNGNRDLYQFIIKCDDSKDESEKKDKKVEGYWIKIRDSVPCDNDKFADEELDKKE